MKFLLVCEGSADEGDLRAMTEHALRFAHDWVAQFETVEAAGLQWVRPNGGEPYLRWADIKKTCEDLRVPPVLRLGMPLHAASTRRVLNALSKMGEDISRVIFVHDSDGNADVRESIESTRDAWLQERDEKDDRQTFDVGVGVANPEHEAWLIAMFKPRDEGESSQLQRVKQRLGFDPTLHPERLTSGRVTDPKDAKRVLRELLGDDSERREALLREATIPEMFARSDESGLRPFVVELVTRVATAGGVVAYERGEQLPHTLAILGR